MALAPIDAYRKQIEKELQAGNATEHTHRPALKDLIESLASGVIATNEPKQVECGAPDFIVSRKAPHGPVTVGHIEAKDVGKPLDEIEKSDQLKRYLPALPNLILTDYLEFRWYVNGDHRHTARIARVAKSGKLTPEKDGAQTVTDLLTAFLSHEAQAVNNPKDLALRMARLTHFIRDMIVAAFGGAGVPPVGSHGQDAHATTIHGQDARATGQYFEGVPPEVWNFHIGGYQVCEKWLKDRRGRTLTYDDLEHYPKVVTALSETLRLMSEIDAAIPKWPIE